MAQIHAAAFQEARPWSADEIDTLMSSKHVFVVMVDDGFAMGRVIIDEVELLTIAVRPEAQGQGLGRALLLGFEETAYHRGACRGFLDVAEDNISARHLYRSSGWTESGRRRNYYARQTGDFVDAILLSK